MQPTEKRLYHYKKKKKKPKESKLRMLCIFHVKTQRKDRMIMSIIKLNAKRKVLKENMWN